MAAHDTAQVDEAQGKSTSKGARREPGRPDQLAEERWRNGEQPVMEQSRKRAGMIMQPVSHRAHDQAEYLDIAAVASATQPIRDGSQVLLKLERPEFTDLLRQIFEVEASPSCVLKSARRDLVCDPVTQGVAALELSVELVLIVLVRIHVSLLSSRTACRRGPVSVLGTMIMSQSRRSSRPAGGDEGLEQARPHELGHTRAVVMDVDGQRLVERPHTNADLGLIGGALASSPRGVEHQVDQDLLDQRWIGEGFEFGITGDLEHHASAAWIGAQQGHGG